jgi:hypothetical protein
MQGVWASSRCGQQQRHSTARSPELCGSSAIPESATPGESRRRAYPVSACSTVLLGTLYTVHSTFYFLYILVLWIQRRFSSIESRYAHSHCCFRLLPLASSHRRSEQAARRQEAQAQAQAAAARARAAQGGGGGGGGGGGAAYPPSGPGGPGQEQDGAGGWRKFFRW